MSGLEEKISRSIKAANLPEDYVADEIKGQLENVGQVVETKQGVNYMILTFANDGEKELGKMYDGCPIGEKYTLELVEPTLADFGAQEQQQQAPVEEPKVEEPQIVEENNEPEVQHQPESAVEEQVEEPVVVEDKPQEEEPKEPEPVEQKKEEEVVEEPVQQNEIIQEAVKEEVVEESYQSQKEEPIPEQPSSSIKTEEPRVEQVIQEEVSKPIQSEPERPQVVEEQKSSSLPQQTEQQSGEGIQTVFANFSLPNRTKLAQDDTFQAALSPKFVLYFAVAWSIWYFISRI